MEYLYKSALLANRKSSLKNTSLSLETHKGSGRVQFSDAEYIVDIFSKDKLEIIKIFETNPYLFAEVILRLLNNLKEFEEAEYCLALIHDVLDSNTTNIQYFRQSNIDDLIVLLQEGAAGRIYLWLLASRIILELYLSGVSMNKEKLVQIMDTFPSILTYDDREIRGFGIRMLQRILENPESRVLVATHSITMTILEGFLRGLDTSFQIRYDTVVCLWIMTFEETVVYELVGRGIISVLLELIRNSVKEKSTRICLATLRNILTRAPKQAAIALADHRTLTLLESLISRRWSDDDILIDLQFIQENVAKNTLEIESSFVDYASELRAGKLEWNAVHASASFWKQHALKLNENDYELLSSLIKQLIESENVVTLGIAAHDLGEYVRYYPRGKLRVQQLGGKDRLMELLSHPEAKVRSEALLAIQKYMVTNWQGLSTDMETMKMNDTSTTRNSGKLSKT